METNQHQQLFFKYIKSVVPSNISLVDDIAALLNISNDSAYRRIRGEKSISFEEVISLSRHYHVSLDQLMDINSDCTVFYGKNVEAENFDFESYLNEILVNLKRFSFATNKMMYYEAQDIPIFHHFQFPELASFKYFFWMKSVLYYPSYNKMMYEDCELKEILIKTGIEITKTYNPLSTLLMV